MIHVFLLRVTHAARHSAWPARNATPATAALVLSSRCSVPGAPNARTTDRRGRRMTRPPAPSSRRAVLATASAGLLVAAMTGAAPAAADPGLDFPQFTYVGTAFD